MTIFTRDGLGDYVYIIKQQEILTDEEAWEKANNAAAEAQGIPPNTLTGRIEGFLTGGGPEGLEERDNRVPAISADTSDVLVLSSTPSYSITLNGKTTNHPVGSRQSVSDHYTSEGAVLSWNGIISPRFIGGLFSSVVTDIAKTPETYLKTIKSFFESDQNLVTVSFPGEAGEPNCVLTSFRAERHAKYQDSYKITMSAKKIKEATSAVSPSQAANNTTQGGATQAQSNGKEVGDDDIPSPSIKDANLTSALFKSFGGS